MGTVTLSSTLGGSIKVEGRYSRLVPFDTGLGVVPASGTTITGGGSGVLVAVYDTTLGAVPVAAGAAMPASGYALLKQWDGVAFPLSTVLTGITATVATDHILGSGTDRVGWVEVVARGNAATNWTVNRLNNPTDPICEGLPYEIGVTSGSRATTYQIPSNGVNQYHGGVFVETAVGSGIYEGYPVSNDTMTLANISTTAIKGKWCHIDAATGVLRFGHDGTNSSGGYCPVSGLKIVIGNVFLTGADTAAKTQNYYSATTSARGRFITSGAGRIDVRWASFNWGFGSLTTAQYLNFENCSIVDNLAITNPAIAPIFDNVVVGSPVGFIATNLSLSNIPVGVTATKLVIGKSGQAATANCYGISITDASLLYFDNCQVIHSGARGSATQFSIVASRVATLELTDCNTSYGWTLSSTTGFLYDGGTYWNSQTLNDSANATYLLAASTLCAGVVVDGVTIENGDLPRNGLLNGGSSCADMTFRNIGSLSSVIGTGIPDGDDVSCSRSSTTLTITSTAHGLATGDIITVTRSENVASAARGEYTVTYVDANNFTIPVVSSGSTSYKVSYTGSQMARLLLLATNSNVKLQNVHVRSTRTATYGLDNSSQEVSLENITTDYADEGAAVLAANNLHGYGMTINPSTQSATASEYGTHIVSGFTAPIGLPSGSGLSWTRSSTTTTVTKTDHGLYTGQRIQILFSDNQPGAYSAQVAVVTALTKDTFSFTGTNSGATSGTNLNYCSADGVLIIFGNEYNEASQDQFSIIAGTPLFTGAGSILMPTVGDEVEWVTERYITDFDHAENMLPLMFGGTISDYLLTYDIDTGSGYTGSFKNAYREGTSAAGTSGLYTVTVTDTTGISAGDYVYGIGIASGAKVVTVDSSTQLTLDIVNAATVSGTLRFSYLPNITGLDADGMKLKIRCKTLTTNVNAITFIRFFFRSTLTTRQVLYPQGTNTNINITVKRNSTLELIENARVYIAADTGGPLSAGDVIATGLTDVNGEFTAEFIHTADQPVTGWVRKASGSPYYREGPVSGVITNDGFTTTVLLVRDE